jgi:hypothetical protein
MSRNQNSVQDSDTNTANKSFKVFKYLETIVTFQTEFRKSCLALVRNLLPSRLLSRELQ